MAVALWGDRGSQRSGDRCGDEGSAGWRSPFGATEDRNNSGCTYATTGRPGGGRPPGRPRIATARAPARCRRPRLLAVALRGDRGSQWRLQAGGVRQEPPGGRPPGRPEIATYYPAYVIAVTPELAVILWGDRGSQPTRRQRTRLGRRPWRSSFGATEDHNLIYPAGGLVIGRLAVSLWGDRGSQLRRVERADDAGCAGGRLPGRPRIAARNRCTTRPSTPSGGRPPG